MKLLELVALLLSIQTWSAPQPVHSEGLIVIYGNQQLVQANSDFRGYDLSLVPGECGFSAISPAMLGRLAWFSVTPHGPYVGPCLSVDAVARAHMLDSVYTRREVAEVSRATAAQLGFTNGGAWGFVWFGVCPPEHSPLLNTAYVAPQPYAPPVVFDNSGHESFWPYPDQELVGVCNVEEQWPDAN